MLFKNCSVAVMNSLRTNPIFVYVDIPNNIVTTLDIGRIYAVFGDWIIFNNADYIIPDRPAYVIAKIRTIDGYGILQVQLTENSYCHPEAIDTLMNLANMDTANSNRNHLATSYYALDDILASAITPTIPNTYSDKDKMQIVVRHPVPIQDVDPNMINSVKQLREGTDMVVINGGNQQQ